MSLSSLPLSYCTNVHSGRSLDEVEAGLDQYTVEVRKNFGEPLAAGLWLAQPVIGELLEEPGAIPRFAERLQHRELTCHTLNAFPYGDFHSERVKAKVYFPDWTQPERLKYTVGCATVLAALLPDDVEGSISTLPLGYKPFCDSRDFSDVAIERLIDCADRLDRIREETGRTIRLAIEPEPFCMLEFTDEVIPIFQRMWKRASERNLLETVQRHLGICFDVCHQSVEFEDVSRSIQDLNTAGVRINKVHVTCALELDRPSENPDGRAALARYVEPRYLHQTMARTSSGEILRIPDLTEQLAREPHDAFLNADMWRIHFHVPVDAESLGPLGTTRADLKKALAAVAELDYAPHLEVETYTWEVLPDARQAGLVDGLTRELAATRTLLSSL